MGPAAEGGAPFASTGWRNVERLCRTAGILIHSHIGTHSELTLEPAVHYIRLMSWRPGASGTTLRRMVGRLTRRPGRAHPAQTFPCESSPYRHPCSGTRGKTGCLSDC